MDETQHLREIADRPVAQRVWAYAKLSGPGYMQSAMTLGGGSVAACVVMGSLLGYKLLWVQPLAIILGFTVLACVGKQTCQTGERPYKAFWDRLHPAFALLWGISAFVSTIIWHFPQYTLTSNGIVELALGAGVDLNNTGGKVFIGALVLPAAFLVVIMYSIGARGLKLYERAVKTLVWGIVFAFAVAAISTGIRWGDLFMGITGIAFLQDVMAGTLDTRAMQPIIGGLAAAVGINMVFLYPYSLLRKNWGKEYKELAYFDLVSGLMIPFLFATGFMIIATANTVGPVDGQLVDEPVKDIRTLVPVLSSTFGESLSLAIIGFGMLAIGFSTIITHMLACGFIGCEMFNKPHDSIWKHIFALAPGIGVLGVAFQSPWYVAITASTLSYPLMPVAVACFLVLLNKKDYMGDAKPTGGKALLWNGVLIAAIAFMSIAAARGLAGNYETLMNHLNPEEETAAAPVQTMDDATPAHHAAADGAYFSSQFTHPAMGTQFELVITGERGVSTASNHARLAEEVFTAIDELEAVISEWQPDSQTTYLNEHAGSGPVPVDADLYRLVTASKRIHAETGGAFDITVGPLVNLWRQCKAEGRIPTEPELAGALAVVGSDLIQVDTADRRVGLEKPGMAITTGAIGKGFALDMAAEILRFKGVTSAILHGGESTAVAIGTPPGELGWTVQLRHPYNNSGYIETLVLKDESFSSSAGVGDAFEVDGKSYGHIYDPRTGMPAEGLVMAVAVAPTGTESDALSTAFYILGEEAVEQYCRDRTATRAVLVPAAASGGLKPRRINFDA